jgi:hypothetical protein
MLTSPMDDSLDWVKQQLQSGTSMPSGVVHPITDIR